MNLLQGCLADFNEMIIQFGFMTLFAVAFPGGAFFALLNNIQEIRSDAKKLLQGHQRPVHSQREDIGGWGSMLHLISYIAVVTNAVIIGFTAKVSYEMIYDSDDHDDVPQISERYERYQLWITVAIAEHAIILLKAVIARSASAESSKLKKAQADLAQYVENIHLEKCLKEQAGSGAVLPGASSSSSTSSSGGGFLGGLRRSMSVRRP